MNQYRRHVNKLGGDVHIELAYALDEREILRRNLRDWDVVDVDVLLANQIEQQIKWTFVDFAELNGEGKIVSLFLHGLARSRFGLNGNNPSHSAFRSIGRRLFRDRLRQIRHFVESFVAS
jgi:hypothetical protein